ncbi:MAG TPA: ABC transporter permease, partial [Mobilitalea sp.]|nr:ABC transporter permease [Mobilitalea sp.]
MDNFYYLVQNTLPVAVGLLLVALGGMFSERSGIINIALEGIMLFGAYAGCVFVYFIEKKGMSPQLIFILGMLVAAIAGLIFSLLLSLAAINMKADQTIVGTALNMLVPATVLLFSKFLFSENSSSDGVSTNTNFYIREVPILSDIPVIGKLFFRNTYLSIYIGAILVIIVAIVLYKTTF